jgi:hypothetical protein
LKLNSGNFGGPTLLSVSWVEMHMLILCATGAACQPAMRIKAGVRDLVQRTGDGQAHVGYGGQTIERSGDALCGLHHVQGDEEHVFLGLASKPRLTISPSLASKLGSMVLVVWPQNHSLGFPVWASKPATVVW